jgi:hypothetical protein
MFHRTCGKKFKKDLKLTTKQNADKTVKNYFSRENIIIRELKLNIDPAQIEIPSIVLPAEMASQWTSLNQEMIDTVIMDNFRRGLHSYLWAGAKTSLGVCLTELKH